MVRLTVCGGLAGQVVAAHAGSDVGGRMSATREQQNYPKHVLKQAFSTAMRPTCTGKEGTLFRTLTNPHGSRVPSKRAEPIHTLLHHHHQGKTNSGVRLALSCLHF